MAENLRTYESTEEPVTDRRGWYAFWSVPLFAAIGLAAHAGRIVELGFTPLCVLVGLYLCFRYPRIYIAFVVMLVCFSPTVRRIADYYSGYTEQSPVLYASPLVGILAGVRLLSLRIFQSRYLCYSLPLLAIVYGMLVGVLQVGGKEVFVSGVGWLFPLAIGVYCAFYEDQERSLTHSFILSLGLCSTVVGVYGVVQYLWPTSWDLYWLTQCQLTGGCGSMGRPDALAIRVFSTMNAPETAAIYLGCGFIVLIFLKSRWRYAALVPVLLALLFTQLRAEWIAFAGAVVLMLVVAGTRGRLKFFAASLLLIPIAAAAFTLPAGEKIAARLASFQDAKHDSSYNDRSNGLATAAQFIAVRPFGMGVGSLDSRQFGRWQFTLGPHDLGLLEVPFSFGFLGGGLFCAGAFLATFSILGRGLTGSRETRSLAILSLHLLLLLVADNPFAGAVGILFWAPTGLLLNFLQSKAGTTYHGAFDSRRPSASYASGAASRAGSYVRSPGRGAGILTARLASDAGAER